MRPKRMLVWVPLFGLAACSPGIVVLAATTHCWGLPWFCQGGSFPLELMDPKLFIVITWLALIVVGLRAGAAQLIRTRRATQYFLHMQQIGIPVHLVDLARALGIYGRLDVVDSPLPEAFCYGIVRPRICVTTGVLTLLSAAEIEAVLRHERHHLRRFDPLRALLWTMLDGAYWWMEQGGEQARLRRELAADRAVIVAGGRLPLASALLKLLAHPCRRTIPMHELAVSGISVTDARIDQLLRPEHVLSSPPPAFHWFVVPMVLSLAALLCTT